MSPESERVIIAAPMSFAGSAERIWRITNDRSGWPLAGMVSLAVLLIILAWVVVLAWYCLFGLFLVPYRIIRRGQRKRKQAAMRHREVLGKNDP